LKYIFLLFEFRCLAALFEQRRIRSEMTITCTISFVPRGCKSSDVGAITFEASRDVDAYTVTIDGQTGGALVNIFKKQALPETTHLNGVWYVSDVCWTCFNNDIRVLTIARLPLVGNSTAKHTSQGKYHFICIQCLLIGQYAAQMP